MMIERRCDRCGDTIMIVYPGRDSDLSKGFKVKAYRNAELTCLLGFVSILPGEDDGTYELVELWVAPEERKKHIAHIMVGVASGVVRNARGNQLFVRVKPEDDAELRLIYSKLEKQGLQARV